MGVRYYDYTFVQTFLLLLGVLAFAVSSAVTVANVARWHTPRHVVKERIHPGWWVTLAIWFVASLARSFGI